MFLELNMFGPFNVASRVGGKEFCSVALGHLGQTLLDTLDIDTHGIHGPCDQNRFGRHEIPGMWDTVPGQHFSARTTHSHQVNAFGPVAFGRRD